MANKKLYIEDEDKKKYIFRYYTLKIKGTKFDRFVTGYLTVKTSNKNSKSKLKHIRDEKLRFEYSLKGYDSTYVQGRAVKEVEYINDCCHHLVSYDSFKLVLNLETKKLSIDGVIDRNLLSFLDNLNIKYGINVSNIELLPKTNNCSSEFIEESISNLIKKIK